MNQASQIEENEEISLKDLINGFKFWIIFLKSKIKYILLVSILSSIIGLVYAILQPVNYKASLTFALEEDKGGGASGALGLASQFGIDLGGVGGGGGAFSTNNLSVLIKSRLIVEKTLMNEVYIDGQKIKIIDLFIKANNLKEGWKGNKLLENINYSKVSERSQLNFIQDSIIQIIYKAISKGQINIEQKDKKATILTLEVETANQLLSKILCENLAKEVSSFYIETKSKKARTNVEILERQTDSIRRELNMAISGAASLSDNVYNLNPSLIIKRTPASKRQFDVQANTAILTQLISQLELSRVALRRETPLIQVIDKPFLPLEKVKVGKSISMIVGVIIGFFLSIIFFILREKYNEIMSI